MSTRIAAIDIGTNSLHMIIADSDGGGEFDVIDREKDMLKLGTGVFRTGRLSESAMQGAIEVLGRFATLIERQRVDHVLAVATSAVREAKNGREFLAAVQRKTGIAARIVSGEEEARLIHRGVRNVIELTKRKALIFDIGGGSVEAIVGDEHGMELSKSLGLGVLRLRDVLGDEDPLSRDTRKRLESMVRETAGDVLSRARQIGFEIVVGTAGTILALGLAAHMRRGHERWRSPDGRVVRRSDLRDLADVLTGMDRDDRAAATWIDAHRADTIHLGAVVLDSLLDVARAESIILCDASIRHGVLLEHLDRGPAGTRERRAAAPFSAGEANIRRRSVARLMRRCGQAGPHAVRVRDLALQIFDQTARLHPRGVGAAERELLEFAALLHDVGRHIAFEHHEHHGYHVIRHGGLRGFSDVEVETIALVARYHRKATPKARHREMVALSPRRRRAVRLLAGILRVAEGLDRGHVQAVRSVRCEVLPTRLRVTASVACDAELEFWAARRKAELLERIVDRKLDFQVEAQRDKS